MLKLCARKMRKEDNSLVGGFELKERGRKDQLEVKCAPLVENGNALVGENESLKLEIFREDLPESTYRKAIKKIDELKEKAKEFLENLENDMANLKNLKESLAYERNDQLEIEYASLVENFENPGVVKTQMKGVDGTIKGNKIVHEIRCKTH